MTEAKIQDAIENAQQGKPKFVKWTLENPIPRPGGDLTEIMLRKPKAGELRGIAAAELAAGNPGAVLALLPRISDPFITEQEAEGLETEDYAEVAGIIMSFFWSKAQRAQVEQIKRGSA